MKRAAYSLAGPEKRPRTLASVPDWLDLPFHLPNTVPELHPVSLDTHLVRNSAVVQSDGEKSELIGSSKSSTNSHLSDRSENCTLGSLAIPVHATKSTRNINQPHNKDGNLNSSTRHKSSDSKNGVPNLSKASEEESSKQIGEPIFIEGTTILLQTEEDIAKWIEERRRNWPTLKNVAAKAARQQQEQPQPSSVVNTKKPVCRCCAKTGRCRFGKKCKNLHESAGDANTKIINGIAVKVPQRYKNKASGGTLFKNLVQRDLFEHQNNVVIDFILYLLSNSLLDRNVTP